MAVSHTRVGAFISSFCTSSLLHNFHLNLAFCAFFFSVHKSISLRKIKIVKLPQRYLHVDHHNSVVLEDKCKRRNWLRSLPTNLRHRA